MSNALKVHVGCGRHVLDGWYNCDAALHPKALREPEALCDARTVPLADSCASHVMACHVIEHFYRWEVGDVLAEWRRLLQPGGMLILELPDLEKAARNLLRSSKDQDCMWPLYGDPSWRDPLMCHRWGYTTRTLRELLEDCGFGGAVFLDPQTHGRRLHRDMRCEARKV